jgi:hypothetical protein
MTDIKALIAGHIMKDLNMFRTMNLGKMSQDEFDKKAREYAEISSEILIEHLKNNGYEIIADESC